MIAVDASAILAIVFQEDDVATFEAALAGAGGGVISAVDYWEVLTRARGKHGRHGADLVEALLAQMRVQVVAVDATIARAAVTASERFKGRAGGRLNLGDCFAYALAAKEGDGLLYKGNDFPKTDVKSVL